MYLENKKWVLSQYSVQEKKEKIPLLHFPSFPGWLSAILDITMNAMPRDEMKSLEQESKLWILDLDP